MPRIISVLLVLGSLIGFSSPSVCLAQEAGAGSEVPTIIEGGGPETGAAVESHEEKAEKPPQVEEKNPSPWAKWSEGFRYSIRALGYGVYADTVNSPLTYAPVIVSHTVLPYGATSRVNPSLLNNFQVEGDLRPDFFWNSDRVELVVKPRFESIWKEWTTGPLDGTEQSEGKAFVNEWLARVRVYDSVFLSYGRENLQWGPSYLLPVSNPFIRNNGRNNPYIEVPGTDLARAVWVLSNRWTVSAIANTEEGRQGYIEGFHRSYAAKIDYTGDNNFFSLIPQGTETEGAGVGYFGGWNITDAVLVYSEGRLYNNFDQVLAGSSYTFKSGPVVSAEYYHNTRGSRTEPFYRALPPFENTFLDEPLLRTNYLMLQFMDNGIRDVLNVTLRWIGDFDDGSSRTIGILEYEVGSHTKLFAVGSYDSGGASDELGSVVRGSAFVGAQYTF